MSKKNDEQNVHSMFEDLETMSRISNVICRIECACADTMKLMAETEASAYRTIGDELPIVEYVSSLSGFVSYMLRHLDKLEDNVTYDLELDDLQKHAEKFLATYNNDINDVCDTDIKVLLGAIQAHPISCMSVAFTFNKERMDEIKSKSKR